MSWTDAEFCENSCVCHWLSSLLFSHPFLEFIHSHRYHDGGRCRRVHAYCTSVPRSDGPCCLHATWTVEQEQHSRLSSRVHRRLVQLQLCRSSPDAGPAVKRPIHRPFRGGRRRQCRCIPDRALPRGCNLDNDKHSPLTATVIDLCSCSSSFLKFAHVNVQSCRYKTAYSRFYHRQWVWRTVYDRNPALWSRRRSVHHRNDTWWLPVSLIPQVWQEGRGHCPVFQCSLKSISVKRLNYQSFEAVEAKLFHRGKSMSFACTDPIPAELTISPTKCFRMNSLVSLLTWQVGHASQWL